MRRDDVKIGVEYAVRRGRHGNAAHVVILGEKTVEVRRYSGTGMGYGYRADERGFEARLIDGDYMPGMSIPRLDTKGKVGFVRPRDLVMTWAEWDKAHAAERAAAEARKRKEAALADERRELEQRVRKVIGVEDYELRDAGRYGSEALEIERPVLRLLITIAERAGTASGDA